MAFFSRRRAASLCRSREFIRQASIVPLDTVYDHSGTMSSQLDWPCYLAAAEPINAVILNPSAAELKNLATSVMHSYSRNSRTTSGKIVAASSDSQIG